MCLLMRGFLLFFLLFRVGCGEVSSALDYETENVTVHAASGPVTVSAEIADTEEKRRYGLMNRKDLGQDAGMLFVFDEEAPRSFWMKNTYLSLDLLFIAASGEIVYVERAATPLSLEPISPPTPARWVLEVKAGWAERHGVSVGDLADLAEVKIGH